MNRKQSSHIPASCLIGYRDCHQTPSSIRVTIGRMFPKLYTTLSRTVKRTPSRVLLVPSPCVQVSQTNTLFISRPAHSLHHNCLVVTSERRPATHNTPDRHTQLINRKVNSNHQCSTTRWSQQSITKLKWCVQHISSLHTKRHLALSSSWI
jgi:hypothetical protein